MRLTDGRGLKNVRWGVGELVLSDDMEFNSYVDYTNFVDLLTLLIDPEDESVDRVFSGIRLESITSLSFSLSTGAAISFSGYYYLTSWGFVANPGSAFVAIIPESTNFAVGSADPNNDRYDTVEVRPTDEGYADNVRTFIDPITENMSENVVPTKRDFGAEFQVLTGTPGGSAPASTEGWIKIAEVRVPNGVSSLTSDDIRTVGRSDEWTTDAGDTIRSPIEQSKTIPVGSGERFETLNEALRYYSDKLPPYKQAGIKLTLELQSGFTMSEQVLVHGMDLGWIRVTSVDSVVTIDRSALTTSISGIYPAFAITSGGVLPVIASHFSMDTSGTASSRAGILVADGSTAVVNSGGIQDAVEAGLYVQGGSRVVAKSSDFSNAGTYGLYAARGSQVSVEAADLGGAGTYSVYAIQGSVVNAHNATCGGGIRAESGATVNAVSSTGSVSVVGATVFDSNGDMVLGNASVDADGHGNFSKVNTGQGDNELYPMDQGVRSSDSPTFASVNTGQGDNELYPMDQPVRESDSPTFASVNTGQGDNELYPMDQPVHSNADVVFGRVVRDKSTEIINTTNTTAGDIFNALFNFFEDSDDGTRVPVKGRLEFASFDTEVISCIPDLSNSRFYIRGIGRGADEGMELHVIASGSSDSFPTAELWIV